MTEHFWVRKKELCGSSRKPPRDSKAVREAYEWRMVRAKKAAAMKAAIARLGRALSGWGVYGN